MDLSRRMQGRQINPGEASGLARAPIPLGPIRQGGLSIVHNSQSVAVFKWNLRHKVLQFTHFVQQKN